MAIGGILPVPMGGGVGPAHHLVGLHHHRDVTTILGVLKTSVKLN